MGGLNKRAHLIEIGQEVIWSKGYDLCSIKDITTAAGLPKGSFYHYFESKEKFALEAMHTYLENNQEIASNEEISLSALEEIIDKRIAAVIKINFVRECYMSVMCHAFSTQEEAFRLSVVEGINAANKMIRDQLIALKTKDLIAADLKIDELLEFIDFSWRGARLKARITKSEFPLMVFKKYLFSHFLQKNNNMFKF